jgi:hypothetical protein
MLFVWFSVTKPSIGNDNVELFTLQVTFNSCLNTLTKQTRVHENLTNLTADPVAWRVPSALVHRIECSNAS